MKKLSQFRKFVAAVAMLAGSITAQASPSDCAGIVSDGTVACTAPLYQPTIYNACVETMLAAPETTLQNCRANLGYALGYPNEAAVSATINCAFGGGGAISWLGNGQTHTDGQLCWTRTVAVVNGVEVRGWGHNTNASFGVAVLRDRTPYCNADSTQVTGLVNGVSEVVACKPRCLVSDTAWAASVGACKPKVVELRSKKKPIEKKPAPNELVSIVKSCPAAQPNPSVGNPIHPLSGTKTETIVVGMGVGGSSLILTYDTTNQATGSDSGDLPSFGSLWTSSLHRKLIVSASGDDIKAYRGNAGVVGFSLVAGTYRTDANNKAQLAVISGGYRYTDMISGTLETYNAAGQLTNVAEIGGTTLAFTYSDGATPAAIAPAPGYLIQVTDNTARSLGFKYTLPSGGVAATEGLVSQIADASGRIITTAYDANKNLIGLTWADGKTRSFLYENTALPWALTGVVDERNIRYSTFGYDAAGRAISTENSGGVNRYSVTYGSPPASTVTQVYDAALQVVREYHDWQAPTDAVLTMPNGQSATLGATTVLGSLFLTESSQPAGSGCGEASSQSTIDAFGNLLSKDNFDGERSCFAYDSSNREVVRVEGLANTVACSTVTPSAAVLPPGARKTVTQWHPDSNSATQARRPGLISSLVYNGQPDPFVGGIATCSAAGNLPNGMPLPLICKHVESASILSTDPAVADPEAGSLSLLLHGDGPNNSTTFTDSSTLTKTPTTFGATKISTAHSKFGGSSILMNGTTDYLQYPANVDFDFGSGDFTVEMFWRPLDTNVDSALVSLGNAAIAANSDLAFGLDHLGASVSGKVRGYVVLGSTKYSVDSLAALNANQWYHLALTRVSGTLSLYVDGVLQNNVVANGVINAPVSRLLKIGKYEATTTRFANGNIDELRITKGVARYASAFTPAAQAFPNVLDSASSARTTTFTYDTAGRILTSTDARGYATTYAYYSSTSFTGTDPDAIGHTLGDLQSITNATGHVTQFTLYDKVGRIRQVIDPKNVTTDISYTPRGWVSIVSVTPPGLSARQTSYTHDDAGQVTAVSLPDGTGLTFNYDAAHRLVGASDEMGNQVIYTLDNVGNRVAEDVKDPTGVLQRSVSRSFDALNRLQQVTGARQ